MGKFQKLVDQFTWSINTHRGCLERYRQVIDHLEI